MGLQTTLSRGRTVVATHRETGEAATIRFRDVPGPGEAAVLAVGPAVVRFGPSASDGRKANERRVWIEAPPEVRFEVRVTPAPAGTIATYRMRRAGLDATTNGL